MAKEVIELAGIITENKEIGRRNTNKIINMMGVKENEEEKLDAKEAIERLEKRSKEEGLTEGRNNEKKEIAEKM